jgi:hypothetical protein
VAGKARAWVQRSHAKSVGTDDAESKGQNHVSQRTL